MTRHIASRRLIAAIMRRAADVSESTSRTRSRARSIFSRFDWSSCVISNATASVSSSVCSDWLSDEFCCASEAEVAARFHVATR